MVEIVSSVIGGCGILANAIIYQQKAGKRMLVWKLISDILWAAHYFTLGGISAAAIACIGVIREAIVLNKGKKWADSKLWLLFFVVLSIAAAIFTWKSPMSILPALASLISVFSFWRAKPLLSKWLAYLVSACMLSYDILVLSYTGMVNEVLTLISTTIGIITLKISESEKKI